MRRVMGWLAIVSRLGLGGVFVYAGWMKLQEPLQFFEAIKAYDMLPVEAVGLVAVTLPALELLAGAALVITKWSREAALLICAMLTVFLIGLVQAAVRGLDISCGCFGDSGETGTGELLRTIGRDVVMMIPTVWLAFFRKKGWLWREA